MVAVHTDSDRTIMAKKKSASKKAKSGMPSREEMVHGDLSLADVADHLATIGELIQIVDDGPFRSQAYISASRAIEQMPGSLADNLLDGTLKDTKGVGSAIHDKMIELATTGEISAEKQLREEIPAGLIECLGINGFGPKKVRKVWTQLGVTSLDELEAVAKDGRLAGLSGFGKKSAENILAGIEYMRTVASRFRVHVATRAAESVEAFLAEQQKQGAISRYQMAGSLRRAKETVGDLDFLCAADEAHAPGVIEAFTSLPGIQRVLVTGPTKASVILEEGIQADLRVVREPSFAFALAYFTGSKEHNIVMRQRAIARGLRLNEYGLFRDEDGTGRVDDSEHGIPCDTEEAIFAELGIPHYIPPELREDRGEFEAAEAGELPDLLDAGDIRGLFHMHTTWSDGRLSMEEIAEVAVELGYEYFGITDHSQTAIYANGLTPDRVREQFEEIDEVNQQFKGKVTLLKGIESDILPDGQLDYDDDLLAEFDFVIASVHSSFLKDRKKMTDRIITAIRHPETDIVGHLTGRLLLDREGYPVDTEAILQACAETNTAIEINTSPHRLDLDWRWVKRARDLGVMIVLSPDAHSRSDFDNLRYGIGMARKGWLEAKDILNNRSLAGVRKWLAR